MKELNETILTLHVETVYAVSKDLQLLGSEPQCHK